MQEIVVKLFFSVPETAEALGVGTTTIKKLIRSGDLHSVKLGDRRLIPAGSVTSFAEQLIEQQAA